jgi:hypothetical protein
MPAGKPAPPRPRRLASLTTCCHLRQAHRRHRLAQGGIASERLIRLEVDHRLTVSQPPGERMGLGCWDAIAPLTGNPPWVRPPVRARPDHAGIIDHQRRPLSQLPRQQIGSRVKRPSAVVWPKSMPRWVFSAALQLVIAGQKADRCCRTRLMTCAPPAGGRSDCRRWRPPPHRWRDADHLADGGNGAIGHPAARLLNDLERFDRCGARIFVVRHLMLDRCPFGRAELEGST